VPDAIFAHPKLARIYDAFDGNRDDLDLYINLIRELGAQHVLDVGCGTGSLPVLLASSGVKSPQSTRPRPHSTWPDPRMGRSG